MPTRTQRSNPRTSNSAKSNTLIVNKTWCGYCNTYLLKLREVVARHLREKHHMAQDDEEKISAIMNNPKRPSIAPKSLLGKKEGLEKPVRTAKQKEADKIKDKRRKKAAMERKRKGPDISPLDAEDDKGFGATVQESKGKNRKTRQSPPRKSER